MDHQVELAYVGIEVPDPAFTGFEAVSSAAFDATLARS